MSRTVSGHGALLPGSSGLDIGTVPGSGMRVQAAAWALPVLLDFLRRWQAHPDLGRGRLNLSTGLNGSYNYRKANAASSTSDHAGYAVDLRYDVLRPDNRRHMTTAERAAVHALLEDYRGALRWGGDYRRLIDEMHIYVAQGQTAATFTALRKRLGIQLDGTRRDPVPPAPPYPGKPIGWPSPNTVSEGPAVAAVQRCLGVPVTGKFDRATRNGLAVWTATHPSDALKDRVGIGAAGRYLYTGLIRKRYPH